MRLNRFNPRYNPFSAAARYWLHFWRAVRYWHFLHYRWNLAWHKARRS